MDQCHAMLKLLKLHHATLARINPPINIHTYIHTYMHTYIHIYIHTYISFLNQQATELFSYFLLLSVVAVHTYIHTYIHLHTSMQTHVTHRHTGPYREFEVFADGEGANEEVVLVDEAGHASHLGGDGSTVVLNVGVHHHLAGVPLRQGRHQRGLAAAAVEEVVTWWVGVFRFHRLRRESGRVKFVSSELMSDVIMVWMECSR